MEKLQVYAAFDWLPVPTLVGTLSFEMLRGTPSYGFSFDAEWLKLHRTFLLSGDLMNYTGNQYKTGDIFGCFGDAMPDRWGKRLIDKRERIKANQENASRKPSPISTTSSNWTTFRVWEHSVSNGATLSWEHRTQT